MGSTLNFAATSPRPDLADSLEKFDLMANASGFVGLKIAPSLEVSEAFGEYPVVEPGDLLKVVQTLRNSDGSYRNISGRVGKDSYRTEEHGLVERIDDRYAAVHRGWFNSERLATMRLQHALALAHNKRVITVAEAVSNTTAAGTAWSTTANADPVANVRTAKLALRDRIGMATPIKMVLELETFEFLKDCDAIINRLKYAGFRDPERSNISAAALESVFDVDEIIVSTAKTNSADDPNAATFANAWDKTKCLLFVAGSGDTIGPQYMRTFHWGGDGSSIGGTIESYGDDARRSDNIRVRFDVEEKEIYSDAAQLITGVQ